MNSILIRSATLNDVDHILTLERTCFKTDLMSRASVRHFQTGKTAALLVAESNNKVVGAIVLLFRKNSPHARMYSLAVDPEYRKLGVALKLCQAAEKTAIKRQCNAIILEVHPDNQSAIRFYEKNHFSTFGHYQHFYEDGASAIRMKKILI